MVVLKSGPAMAGVAGAAPTALHNNISTLVFQGQLVLVTFSYLLSCLNAKEKGPVCQTMYSLKTLQSKLSKMKEMQMQLGKA